MRVDVQWNACLQTHAQFVDVLQSLYTNTSGVCRRAMECVSTNTCIICRGAKKCVYKYQCVCVDVQRNACLQTHAQFVDVLQRVSTNTSECV